jgi:lipoyl(octanoyl) transferase
MKATTDSPIRSEKASLEVFLLGLVDFDACLHLQERLAAEIGGSGDGHGALLVCEHPPLVTIGREGSRAHIRCSAEELLSRQLEVRWIGRGGGCILHAPGQLAVYPIVAIDQRRIGLAAYRERLELAALEMLEELRIPAFRRDDAAGAWCRGGRLVSLGAAVRSSITAHGLFVNVSPQMDGQRLIRIPEGRVTSIAAERRAPASMAAVRESLIRHLASKLEFERYHLYTGHPMLKRTRRVVAYA